MGLSESLSPGFMVSWGTVSSNHGISDWREWIVGFEGFDEGLLGGFLGKSFLSCYMIGWGAVGFDHCGSKRGKVIGYWMGFGGYCGC